LARRTRRRCCETRKWDFQRRTWRCPAKTEEPHEYVATTTRSSEIWSFGLLLVAGFFLTFIFVAIAFSIGLSNENRIKGFGYAILVWLFMAVIYDGLFLLFLMAFNEYPLDKGALVATMLNPIDLARILVLLKLDVSALLGYTGAVFQKFFGTGIGLAASLGVLSLWTVVPVLDIVRKANKKDF
jgi:Cu-processing system permease protein